MWRRCRSILDVRRLVERPSREWGDAPAWITADIHEFRCVSLGRLSPWSKKCVVRSQGSNRAVQLEGMWEETGDET
jgi:hypothetical protein